MVAKTVLEMPRSTKYAGANRVQNGPNGHPGHSALKLAVQQEVNYA